MNITLQLSCDCGNRESIDVKRTVDAVEDYLEIGESIQASERFKSHQSSPDETRITCLECQKYQDVLI